jgi:hypothetical protein
MKRLSWSQIYKIYKHGGSLKGIPNKDILNALRKNGLQIVSVYNSENKECIYNF